MLLKIGKWQIREFLPSDEDAIVRYADNERIAQNLKDRFPHPYTRGDAQAWLSCVKAGECEGNFAIASADELIGGIGLERQGDIHRNSAELGYWLAEPFWNQGIATLAVQAITEWGFRELQLARIWAGVFETNTASCRVLEKCGYALEGRLRQHITRNGRQMDELLYARIRSDS